MFGRLYLAIESKILCSVFFFSIFSNSAVSPVTPGVTNTLGATTKLGAYSGGTYGYEFGIISFHRTITFFPNGSIVQLSKIT